MSAGKIADTFIYPDAILTPVGGGDCHRRNSNGETQESQEADRLGGRRGRRASEVQACEARQKGREEDTQEAWRQAQGTQEGQRHEGVPGFRDQEGTWTEVGDQDTAEAQAGHHREQEVGLQDSLQGHEAPEETRSGECGQNLVADKEPDLYHQAQARWVWRLYPRQELRSKAEESLIGILQSFFIFFLFLKTPIVQWQHTERLRNLTIPAQRWWFNSTSVYLR